MSQEILQPKSADEIQTWMVQFIANDMKLPPEKVPLAEPLVNIGMTSRQAVFLTGALEDYLGAPVDPTVIWEHPTIQKISAQLASK
jgi:acyl carrier protein